MSAAIDLAIVLLLTVVLVFVVYTLINYLVKLYKKPTSQASAPQASADNNIERSRNNVKEALYDVPYKSDFEEPSAPLAIPPAVPAREHVEQVPTSQPASIREPIADAEQPPLVPGQTQEELKTPEPLQEPIAQKVDLPASKDPYDRQENAALFGSDLRHPEAMMVASSSKFSSLEREVSAGLANEVARPSDIEQVPFSAEMAQNGGQFMDGIFAFDNTDSGGRFSQF
jgi:hypothetical protein